MPALLRTLLQPLNLAAILTWLAVALSLRAETAAVGKGWLWALLLVYLAAFLAGDVLPARGRSIRLALLHALQAVSALTLVWLAPRGGTAPVLLVILVAQLAMIWPARTTLVATIALNLALYALLRANGHSAPLIVTMIYAGFQAFAALTGHYATSAEEARDRLALVNADLLATRALLADSARDAERLRVARDLHDVAGHKLTALAINLRALATEPAFAQRQEIALAQRLSQELLADIRGVVHALRDVSGLDLATALQALAAPLPKLRLQLQIDDALQFTDAAVAETILRVVQEALTNSVRHAEALTLRVTITGDPEGLRLEIRDDGRVRGPLREGNGLAGMRERIEGLGGTLSLATTPRGALRITALLPRLGKPA